MRLLFLSMLTLLSMIFVAIILAEVIGSTRPNTSAATLSVLFTNPNGSPCEKPCFLGVRLGKMTVDEGAQQIISHPYIRNTLKLSRDEIVQSSSNRFMIGNDSTSVDFDGDSNQIIHVINFSSIDPAFTLGSLLAYFGIPRNIEINGFSVHPHKIDLFDIFLTYPDQGFQIFLIYHPDRSMQISDQTANLTIFDSENVPNVASISKCDPPYCQRWQGLKSMRAYSTGFPPF